MLNSVEAKLKVLGILDNRSLMLLQKAEPLSETLEMYKEHVQSKRSGSLGMTMVLVLGLLFVAVLMTFMIRRKVVRGGQSISVTTTVHGS